MDSRSLPFLAQACRLIVLLILTSVASGCGSTVGKYFGDRARDFGECFRIQAGGAAGFGAVARGLGLLDTGWALAVVPRHYGMGWHYGDGYAFGERSFETEAAFLFFIPGAAAGGHTSVEGSPEFKIWTVLERDSNSPDQFVPISWPYELEHAHFCQAFLPCLTTYLVAPRRQERDKPLALWSKEAREADPWAHLHAFDAELSVYAGLVHARVGFSPGEFYQFLVGWFLPGSSTADDDET